MRENEKSTDREQSVAESNTDFAVGVVVTEANVAEVVPTILRARKRDSPVLATYYDSSEQAVETVQQLGAELVHPTQDRPDGESLRDRLVTVARERGFPGVVLYRDTDERIDFERSGSALAECSEYAIEARTGGTASASADDTVLVAIPAFNEARTIASVVEAAHGYADSVLVVDDGSEDQTVSRAEDAGAVVVRHDHNRGYGGALKTAFSEAKHRNTDHLVVIDGDGQHDAEDIPRLVSVQRDTGDDIVVGSRFGDGTANGISLVRQSGLVTINALTAISLKLLDRDFDVWDTQSGFRVYNSRAIETLASDETIGESMSASIDILFHALRYGYSVSEIGTTIEYDGEDVSSRHPVYHGYDLVKTVLRTIERERPITILGFPGFFSAFVGFGFGYWALTNYVQSGSFPVGLAITSTFFALLGILVCFTAIILHSLKSYLDAGPGDALHP